MQKKALVSRDRAFCLKGKASEIIPMTQDLVRMFHIYWVYSALCRYFPVVQMPHVNHSYCIWIPCSLDVNCKPSAESQLVSVGTVFQSSSSHSPTASRNLLTSSSENLKIKHAAVVTIPQNQNLCFKSGWYVWEGFWFFVLFFFLIKLDDFTQQWKQKVKQKEFYLWDAACLDGVWISDCFAAWAWEDAEPVCSSYWESLVRMRGVCDHHGFPWPGVSPIHKFRPPARLSCKQKASSSAKISGRGGSLLGQGDYSKTSDGISRLLLAQRHWQYHHQATSSLTHPDVMQPFIMSSLAAERCV